MGKAKKIFIAAVDKNAGKTTTSIALMALAMKKYDRVGYIKPFGGQTVTYKGRVVDKDVALMAQVFGLNKHLDYMSPVVLSSDITHKVVDGLISPQDLQDKIVHAYNELEKKCDFILIEGSGHPGVGSVMQISNARIAHLLKAPVLMVTGGGLGNVVDRLSMTQLLFEKENVDVKAILVNMLVPDKRDRSLDYLTRALKDESFKVIGGFDYQPILANPTLRRISTVLDLPLHGNKRELQRIIHKVQVGAASTQRVAELIQEPSLIILTSSRDELIVTLSHLYKMPQYKGLIVGLVISGTTAISPMSQQILDDSHIPYIRADKMITAELYHTINKDVSKIVAEDKEKLDLIKVLAEKRFDFDVIDGLISD
jgi:dethiobiotin synthetase